MGVYIKGMELPTSKERCKFYQPAPFRSPYCVINGVCNGLKDCPLSPVPPHGRLIDADEIHFFLVDSPANFSFEAADREEIEAMPTIIEEDPADGEWMVKWRQWNIIPSAKEAEEGE